MDKTILWIFGIVALSFLVICIYIIRSSWKSLKSIEKKKKGKEDNS